MKRFILLCLLSLILLPANSHTIIGEIEYNEGSVLQPIHKLSFESLRNYFYDSNNLENKHCLLQGITELKDRILTKFSDGTYGILYKDNPLYSWYYSSNGKLIAYTQKDTVSYPCQFTKFRPDGSVINSGYRISKKESYIYSFDGKMIAHWNGNYCYDDSNNVIMRREIFK